jgi:hypothetical protein
MFDVRQLSLATFTIILTLGLFGDVSPTIVIEPQNVVVVAGQEARFNCSTDVSESPNPLRWTDNNPAVRVTAGCQSVFMPSFVSFPNTARCDLGVVWTNDSSFAGPYTCNDGSGAKGLKALLVVLESEPVCVPDRDPVVQGQPFNLSCNGNFTFGIFALGNPPIFASMSCDGLGSSSNKSYSLPVSSSSEWLSLPQASFPMVANGTTVPQYSCAVHFYFSDHAISPIKYSINTATYLFSTKSNVNIQYCAANVSITPTTQPYYGGQQITCNADGFPPPNFVWIDNLKSGATVASGANITLPVDGGPFNLNCTALSTGSLSCNISTSVSGFAIASTTTSQAATSGTTTNTPASAANSTGQSTSSGSSDPTLLIVSIVVPTATGIVALGSALACSGWFGYLFYRRRWLRRKQPDETEQRLSPPSQLDEQPSIYALGFAYRPNYVNGYGRF